MDEQEKAFTVAAIDKKLESDKKKQQEIKSKTKKGKRR